MNKKIAILLNPSSGRGRSIKEKAKIEKIFSQYQIDYTFFISESESNLRELAKEVSSIFPVLIGVGGDTTFNIIAREVLQTASPPIIGMIATGSANDIMRGLGSVSVQSVAKAVHEGNIREIDVGCLKIDEIEEPVLFLGTVSAGLGVTVNRYIEGFYKRFPFQAKIDPFVQLRAGLMGIMHSFSSKKVPLIARLRYFPGCIDGEKKSETPLEEIVEFSLLTFLNTPYYANGLKLGERNGIFDRKLECVTVSTCSFVETVKTGISIARGKFSTNHKKVKRREAFYPDGFRLDMEKPFDIQVDGDIYPDVKGADITLSDRKLKVFVCPGSGN